MQALFAAIDIAAPIDERDFPRDMSIPRVQRVRWYRGQSPTRAAAAESTHEEATETPGDAQALSELNRRNSVSTTSASAMVPEREVEQPLRVEDSSDSDSDDESSGLGPRLAHRLSTTSYPNVAIDPFSGKWLPDHSWSEAHDMIYAKLCYSNLLFRSPRKSNYIINKGKQWFVDWTTGKMVRVLPPTYGESDFFGPWQVIHTENVRL